VIAPDHDCFFFGPNAECGLANRPPIVFQNVKPPG
jgi:hypothetical protein